MGSVPTAVKEKLRKLMWDKVGVEKDAAGMSAALEDILQIRSELPRDAHRQQHSHRQL